MHGDISQMNLTVNIVGIDKSFDRLGRLAQRMPRIAAKALNEVAELTMTQALELTPLETGRLKATGKVFHASARSLRARLTYGTDYALAVHEIPAPPKKSPGGRSARHFPPYGTGGQWKYLETPVKNRARTFTQDVGRRMRAELATSRRTGG